MIDYIELGPVPGDEDCAQIGEDNYHRKAMAECHRYLEQLIRKWGEENAHRFGIKRFPHDFGSYFEVVVYFDSDIEDELDFAIKVENNLPANWED
jgi:hypothetical protein